jgi:DNA-3-methyladenine glycosylase II
MAFSARVSSWAMSYAAAVRHLKRVDPVMRRIIERVGPCRMGDRLQPNRFRALVEAIIYQQLAWQAAKTIAGRFCALYGGDGMNPRGKFPRAEQILATPARRLRSVGLSRQKIAYIRDIASRTVSGALPLSRLGRMSDEAVIDCLTAVKGIGRWTAEMFLIFSLRHLDVLPVDDLGVQHAVRGAYGLRRLPSEEKLREIGDPWRPYRTVATWYLWRSRREQTARK